jgi:hypothetical protein
MTAVGALSLPLAVLSISHASGQAVQHSEQAGTGYAVILRSPLSKTSNGIDGYLELRQDARLTPKLRALLWGTGNVDIDENRDLAIFKSEPPRNASIRIVDQAGKVLEEQALERPLAKLRTAKLYGDSRVTYLLTVDYSAGFGSYSGPITNLAEVKGARLRWVEALEAIGGSSRKISLMDSLKTTWKFVDSPDGKGKQILLAQCRPDGSFVGGDQDFKTKYARFYFDGTKWVVLERTVRGFTEFEQSFPSRRYFP